MGRFNPWKKVIIFAVALSGILINTGYAIGNLQAFLDPGTALLARQALATAASFETGWVLLLIWFMLSPGRRGGVLLLSTAPILLASSANSLLHGAAGSEVVTNLAVALGYCGCYLYAYYLGRAITD